MVTNMAYVVNPGYNHLQEMKNHAKQSALVFLHLRALQYICAFPVSVSLAFSFFLFCSQHMYEISFLCHTAVAPSHTLSVSEEM